MLGSHEVVRCSFIDDLILGARTRQELREFLEALQSRWNGHPAGPLHLQLDEPTSAKNGLVRVFGYKLVPGDGYGDNPIHVKPGLERFDRFHRKLLAELLAAHPDGLSDLVALEDFINQRLDHWIPSQQAWTMVPFYSRNLALTCACIYIGDHNPSSSP